MKYFLLVLCTIIAGLGAIAASIFLDNLHIDEIKKPKIAWCKNHGYQYYLSESYNARIYCLDKENRLVYPDVK